MAEKDPGRNDVAIIVACIAAQMPNLKYLRIMDYAYLVRLFISKILLLTKAISSETATKSPFSPSQCVSPVCER